MKNRSSRFEPLLPLLGFGLLALLFTWPLWVPLAADRMTVGPAEGDFLRQFHGYRAFVARALASGRPPLWNPHQYAGTPALADPQQAVLYPWRLLQMPLALGGRMLPLWAMHLELLAHVALAGAFTFGLARRLGAGGYGAGLAGLSFAFGGYLSGYPLEQLAVLDTATWIPALLWSLSLLADRLAAGQAWARPALVSAACATLMLLAGHPQTALYGLWAGLAWFLWRAWPARARSGPWLKAGGLWLLVAAGLSAAQWLPSADLLLRSARSLDPAELAAGFPPIDILQVLAPGGLSQWSPLYVGVSTFALALWGAWRLRAARPWIGLAVAAWLIGLGGNNPAFPLLLRILPGMALFRHQERIAVLWSLGLSVAAGLALGALLRSRAGEARPGAAPGEDSRLSELAWMAAGMALLTGLASAALTLRYSAVAVPVEDFCRPETIQAAAAEWTPVARRLALAGPLAHAALFGLLVAAALWLARVGRLSRSHLALVLLGLSLLDLFGANRGAALCPAEPDLLAVDANLELLLPKARDGRVSSEALLPGGPNAASLFGLYDVTGDSPLQLGRTAALVDEAPEILWWRLLNVRYAITARPPEGAPLVELARSGEAGLYEVQLPVPPVWVPSESRCIEPDRPISSWAKPDLDPQQRAYVDWLDAGAQGDADRSLDLGVPLPRMAPGVEPATSESLCWEGSAEGGSARLTGLDPGSIRVEAELERPGWLILSTAYDPGWRVVARNLDDGRRIQPPRTRAYGSILAARLPAGPWEVRWTYLPSAVIMGLLMSLVTLGASLWLWRRAERAR